LSPATGEKGVSEIQQATTTAVEKAVGPVTAFTVSAGWATVWQTVEGLIGACSCLVGMYVTIKLFRQKREINRLTIKELKKVNHEVK